MADGFHFADGSSAHSTQELLHVLEGKDAGLTQPHVARNDYANWARHALHNDTLADRLEKCRTVQQVIDVLRLEHTPAPRPEPKPEPAYERPAQQQHNPQPQQVHQPEPAPQPASQPTQREPIRDLHKPSEHAPTPPQQQHTPAPEPQPQSHEPAKPDPLPKESLLDRYNAREFLLGFLAGIVLTVLVYGIIGTLG